MYFREYPTTSEQWKCCACHCELYSHLTIDIYQNEFHFLIYINTGAAVGLMLPDSVPLGEREHFEAVLASLTVMRQQEMVSSEVTPTDQGEVTRPGETPREQQGQEEEEEQQSTSTRISKGLLTGKEC